MEWNRRVELEGGNNNHLVQLPAQPASGELDLLVITTWS